MDDHDTETGEIVSDAAPAMPPRQQAKLWVRYGNSPTYPSEYGGNFAALNLALFNALGDIEPVIGKSKTAKVQSEKAKYEYKFAPFDEIMMAVRQPLRNHKLLLTHGTLDIQRMDTGAGIKGFLLPVHTTLFHVASGGWKREVIPMPVARFEPGAVGSANSFGKRYTTLAVLGLATGDEDDDAAKAQKKQRLRDDDEPDSDIVSRIKVEISKLSEKGEQALQEWRAKEATGVILDSMDPDDFSKVKYAYQVAVKKVREAPAKKAKGE